MTQSCRGTVRGVRVRVASQPARASSENADILRAMGELAGELQICSTYFTVASACVKDQRSDLANTYSAAAEKVGILAITGRPLARFREGDYLHTRRIGCLESKGRDCGFALCEEVRAHHIPGVKSAGQVLGRCGARFSASETKLLRGPSMTAMFRNLPLYCDRAIGRCNASCCRRSWCV
jgi:hypothetical protein